MITINEVCNFLHLDNSTNEKSFLENAIKQSVNEVEKYCYTNFNIADITKEVFIENLNIPFITIGAFNIREVVSITFFNDIFATSSVIDLDDISMKKVNGFYRIYLKNHLTIGHYVINLSVGKIVTEIEAEVKSVVLEMVAIKYKENQNGNALLGVSSSNETYPNNNSNFVIRDLGSKWKTILNKYRFNSLGHYI